MISIYKFILGMSVLLSLLVYADDDLSEDDIKVKKVLEEVEALFKQRSSSNPHLIDTILEKLSAVENEADDPNLNYDVYVFESKAIYWKAKYILCLLDQNANLKDHNSDHIALFNLGKAKADAAIHTNSAYADGHYYSGLHLASMIPYVLGVSGERYLLGYEIYHVPQELQDQAKAMAEKAMNNFTNATMRHSRFQCIKGTIDGWGPYREKALLPLRTLRLRSAFPVVITSEILSDIKEAYNHARDYAENIVEYANILNCKSKYEQLLAHAILYCLLSHDPNTYNPDRVAETLLAFKKAQYLMSHGGFGLPIEWAAPHISYRTTKEGLKDYQEATKLQEAASNRITGCQSQLSILQGERLEWIELQKRRHKIFSTLDLLRTKIEERTPELIIKIQAYLSCQQDSLQAVLDDLNREIKETSDPKVRDGLQYDLIILSNLSAVKKNLGNSSEALKKAMDRAIHGNKEERAKALSYFDPLTQAILKWVFETTIPAKETIFTQIKEEIIHLQSFSTEHLSIIESKIQLTTRNLSYAKDDHIIAQYMVDKIYEACQRAEHFE